MQNSENHHLGDPDHSVVVGFGTHGEPQGPRLLDKMVGFLKNLFHARHAKIIGVFAGLFVVGFGVTLFLIASHDSKEPLSVTSEETSKGTLKIDTDGDGVPDTEVGNPETGDGSTSSGAEQGGQSSGSSSSGGSSVGSSGGGSSGGGTACVGAQHTPGGPDGFGGCWPGAHNTGVPSGVVLSAYTGSCTISTPNTTIDSKTVNCDIRINANNITIKNSRVSGSISQVSGSFHFEVIDSEVDGTPNGPEQITSVGGENFLILRSEITGGGRTVLCEHDCEVRDSWLHGQEMPDDVDWHLSAIRLSQRSTAVHNTLACDKEPNNADGGCSANQTGYPDFEPTKNWLMERNLIIGTTSVGYCAYGGASQGKPYSGEPDNATYIVYKDNVFQRGSTGNCGVYGPITSFDDTRTGNVWTNNRWDDGGLVQSEN